MRRTLRLCTIRLAALVSMAAVLACSSAPPSPRSELDRAVKSFIDQDYATAVKQLEAVIAASDDPVLRREAYAYLGRSHMALGETDLAVDAFNRGIKLGDRGPCMAYLEILKQQIEGQPSGLHMSEVLTRGQLAGAIARMFLGGVSADPAGPSPIAQVEKKGWMPAMPDGQDHANEPVTHAALYVVASRILDDSGASEKADRVMPGGYRAAARKTEPVSGSEGLAILERVRSLTTKQ
ncbi:MAG TPA: hypothetical protein VFU38_04125 [Candidatus Krumholzibacteria bacterium]|nr:hypothetical protein [Candidatus Krumholzibacteria bacterium]